MTVANGTTLLKCPTLLFSPRFYTATSDEGRNADKRKKLNASISFQRLLWCNATINNVNSYRTVALLSACMLSWYIEILVLITALIIQSYMCLILPFSCPFSAATSNALLLGCVTRSLCSPANAIVAMITGYPSITCGAPRSVSISAMLVTFALTLHKILV